MPTDRKKPDGDGNDGHRVCALLSGYMGLLEIAAERGCKVHAPVGQPDKRHTAAIERRAALTIPVVDRIPVHVKDVRLHIPFE